MMKLESNRAKFLLMIGLIIVGLVVIYQLSIKVTLMELANQNILNKKMQQYSAQLLQNGESKSKNNLDFSYVLSDSMYFERNQLFDQINTLTIANKSIINTFNEQSSYKKNNYIISTFLLELSGNYPSLIKTLNELEKKQNKFKINSAKFYTVRNIKTRQNQLRLSLYFQTLIKNDS